MPQQPTGHVFMSYSRKDEEIMRRITTFLRNQGIKVWVDNENLAPGTPIWEEEIAKAIMSASAIVAVLSPDAKGSEWVHREVTYADQYEKRVFPVLVSGDEDSSIPIRLITRQFVDIRSKEEVGLNSLSAAISFYAEGIEAREKKAREKAEKLANAQAEREAAERESARLKAELETADLAMRQAAEKAAKEKETRSRAEKRRQRYLEMLHKTIHAIKLYYRRILLIAVAVTLILLGGKVALSFLPLISTPTPRPTRTLIPTATPVSLPLELIISFQKYGTQKGISLSTGGDVDTEIAVVGIPSSQARRTGAGKVLPSLDGNTTGDRFMQFDVDDRIMYAGIPTTFVLIEIEYFDQGKDDFRLDYDAKGNVGRYKNGKFTETCKITKGNTLVFKTATFAIKDARFADQDNGADFRISDNSDGAEIIRLVRVKLLPSLNILVDSCGIVK